MKTGWRALREGWSRLKRYWPALGLAYAVNLLSALALAVWPVAGLLEAARRPALAQAAGGISAGMVVDFFGAGITNMNQGIDPSARALGLATLWALAAAVVLPFLAGIPAAFLNGGLVLTYIEAPAAWRWKRFLWGCWRWFGAFLMLGLGQVLLTLLVATPAAVLMGLVASRAAWALWLLAALLAVVLAAILALFEVGGVWLVAHASRNFAQALGAAARTLVKQAGPLAVLYALALGGLALGHGLYTGVLWPHLPLAVWPLVLLAQQAFILFRLAARLLRLSACASLLASDGGPGGLRAG